MLELPTAMDLISAAKNGNFDLVFNLLRSGCSTSVRDKDNATPLYWSACHGHTNVCEILIQAGSDVNTRVKWGSTALHAAADRGHKSCIEVLLHSGAFVNATNNRGDTALHIAAYRGHVDIIMTLLRAKADVNLRNEKGKTPQQEALEGGHQHIAENIVNFSKGTYLCTRVAAPRAPADTLSIRQPSEVSDEEPFGHEYENASSPRRTTAPPPIFRQNSVGMVPPRPPQNLSRSMSLSDNNNSLRNGITVNNYRKQEDLIEPRTSSIGSLPGIDARRNARCYSPTDGSPVFASNSDSYLTESSAYSSDTSWNNNTSSMTSSSENDIMGSLESPTPIIRDMPNIKRYIPANVTRPNRSSIGSLREINTEYLDDLSPSQGYVSALQRQLVESYRIIERLTSENESLKFKCSTLLNRLADKEQTCGDKDGEFENVRHSMDSPVFGNHVQQDVTSSTLDITTSCDADINGHGFKQLCEHMNKEMSDDSLQEVQDILRESLQNHALCGEVDEAILDAPHREWVPGIDYVILGRQPVTQRKCGHDQPVPKCLSFLIKHLKTGRKLHLKMVLPWSSTSLYSESTTELDIIERIGPHRNVVKVLHTYEGSIERFRKFIPVSNSTADFIDNDLSFRTTFIVTEQMPTLASFIDSAELKSSGYISVFLTHALYQLLSLICLLEELNISHNNINTNSVFIDNELKPVLGNFECATFQDEKSSARFPIQNDEERDYINVTHVSRGSKPCSVSKLPCSDLKQLCKLFDLILMTDTPISTCSTDDTLTDSVATLPPEVWRVINSVITLQQSFSTRDCLQRVGFALCGPSEDDVRSKFQCRTYMQTKMLHLLSFKPKPQNQSSGADSDTDIRHSIRQNMFEIEAHFLCNISTKHLWDLRRTLQH